MSIFISIIRNFLEWVLKLANITSSCTGVLMQVNSKLFKVVIGILACVQVIPELLLLGIVGINFALFFGGHGLFRFQIKALLLNQFVYILLLFLLGFGSFLHFAIVHQPVAKKLNWIARLLTAGGGQTFREDECNIVFFEICNVWVLLLNGLVQRLFNL